MKSKISNTLKVGFSTLAVLGAMGGTVYGMNDFGGNGSSEDENLGRYTEFDPKKLKSYNNDTLVQMLMSQQKENLNYQKIIEGVQKDFLLIKNEYYKLKSLEEKIAEDEEKKDIVIRLLKERVRDLDQKNEELQKQLNAQEQSFSQELMGLKDVMASIYQETEKIRTKAANMEEENAEKDVLIDSLKEKSIELNKKNADLQQQLEEHEQQKQEATANAEELLSKNQELERQLQALRNQLKQSEKQAVLIESLKSKIGQLGRENENLQRQLEEHEQQQQEATSSARRLQSQNQELERQLQALRNQLKQSKKRTVSIESLREQIGQLNQENENLQRQLEEHEQQQQEATSSARRLQSQNQRLNAKYNCLMNNAKRNIIELQQEKQELLKQLQLAKVNEQTKYPKPPVQEEQNQKRVVAATTQLNAHQTNLQKEILNVKGEILRLRCILNGLKNEDMKVINLQKELIDTQQKLNAAQKELVKLEALQAEAQKKHK